MSHKKFKLFPIRNVEVTVNATEKLLAEELDTDFKRRYPPDAQLGEELAENARVWKVYRDEAIQHDDGVLTGWNNTIDILLTFAGLFSAAVTAFVVESYQFLQPAGLDFGAAFYALAVNDTETLHTLAVSTSRPGSAARWINGLWFTSLFFALAAAFLCILVKQWLDEYTARTRASSQNPKHWSRRRAFYFRAIDDWGVAGIISLLPLLLHAALFLFFAGMVVLLWSLSRAVAAWLSGLACFLFCLYAVSVVIPVWNATCPFATPLAKQLRRSWNFLVIWLLRQGLSLSESAAAIAARSRHFWRFQPDLEAACPHPRSINLWKLHKSMQDSVGKSVFDQVLYRDSLSSDEANGIVDVPAPRLTDELDHDALRWLILSVSDSDTNAVGIQSLGALVPCTPLAVLVSRKRITSNISDTQLTLASPAGGGVVEAARILKSLLALNVRGPTMDAEYVFPPIPAGFEYWDRIPWTSTYPDLQLLKYALIFRIDSSALFDNLEYTSLRDQVAKCERTPSLHSTSMLLARLESLKRHHIFLFLLFSELSLVSSAQWQFFMPKLRNNTSPCPRHLCDTHCNLLCFIEHISSLLLQEDTEDVDPLVLKQLFDAICRKHETFMLLPLSALPNFLAYVASNKFISCDPSHPSASARRLTDWISRGVSRIQSPRVDPVWFQAWRHAAYICRLLQSAPVMSPPEALVCSALFDPADRHVPNAAGPVWQSFEEPSPPDVTIRAILVSDDDAYQSVPSIWNLIATEKFGSVLLTAEALATSLCSMSRKVENIDDLVALFFAPLTLKKLVTQMYFFWPRESDNSSLVFPTPALTFCSHVMELGPSWWIEGLNNLSHDTVSVSVIQNYATAITEECLRRGPCYDCPLAVGPLTFDISLRTFAVYPFAVYPEVEIDGDV